MLYPKRAVECLVPSTFTHSRSPLPSPYPPPTDDISVWVDYNNPVVRITASSTKGKKFKVTASLYKYRDSVKKTTLGRGNCQPYNDIPDTVRRASPPYGGAASSPPAITWWHRNDYRIAGVNSTSASYYGWATTQAGIDPASLGPGGNDPFSNLTFGATLRGGSAADAEGLVQLNDTTVQVRDRDSTVYRVRLRIYAYSSTYPWCM